MSVETNVIDIKKAQRQELLMEEAAKRANAMKAYEILPANKIQLPAPELLVDQIRIKPGKMLTVTPKVTLQCSETEKSTVK